MIIAERIEIKKYVMWTDRQGSPCVWLSVSLKTLDDGMRTGPVYTRGRRGVWQQGAATTQRAEANMLVLLAEASCTPTARQACIPGIQMAYLWTPFQTLKFLAGLCHVMPPVMATMSSAYQFVGRLPHLLSSAWW